MSVQNAVSRLLLNELPPTTVMTGCVTQVAIDAAQLLSGRGAETAAARQRLGKFLPPVVAFAVGAIIGATFYSAVTFVALLAPMAALLGVVVISRERSESEERSPHRRHRCADESAREQ